MLLFSTVTMLKARLREWLMDHPKALHVAFTLVLAWTVYVPDEITVQGGGSYQGP